MNTIYFNPYEDTWTCIHDGDIKKRELLLCILKSKGMEVFYQTSTHVNLKNYPHIHHKSKKDMQKDCTIFEVVGRSELTTGIIIVTYTFIFYYFSNKYLF